MALREVVKDNVKAVIKPCFEKYNKREGESLKRHPTDLAIISIRNHSPPFFWSWQNKTTLNSIDSTSEIKKNITNCSHDCDCEEQSFWKGPESKELVKTVSISFGYIKQNNFRTQLKHIFKVIMVLN